MTNNSDAIQARTQLEAIRARLAPILGLAARKPVDLGQTVATAAARSAGLTEEQAATLRTGALAAVVRGQYASAPPSSRLAAGMDRLLAKMAVSAKRQEPAEAPQVGSARAGSLVAGMDRLLARVPARARSLVFAPASGETLCVGHLHGQARGTQGAGASRPCESDLGYAVQRVAIALAWANREALRSRPGPRRLRES